MFRESRQFNNSEKSKLDKELVGVAGGLAVVELAPAITKEVFETMGSEAEIMPGEIPGVDQVGNNTFGINEASEGMNLSGVEGFEGAAEGVIEFAQGVAVPVATVLIAYYGLKHMFKGFRNEKSN
jgi:hypothetical protein